MLQAGSCHILSCDAEESDIKRASLKHEEQGLTLQRMHQADQGAAARMVATHDERTSPIWRLHPIIVP
eukprot:6185790-Pleurochrysis_carterae.AAC.3